MVYLFDVTQLWRTAQEMFVPKEYNGVFLDNLGELQQFAFDAVIRGGYVSESKIVDANGYCIVPESLWEPLIDHLYDEFSSILNDHIDTANSYDGGDPEVVLSGYDLTHNGQTIRYFHMRVRSEGI